MRRAHPIVAVVPLVVALLACGTARPAVALHDGEASARPREPLATRAATIRLRLDELVAAGAPGAIVLYRDGKQTLRVAGGYENVARKAAMRVVDRFRVGSVTKTFVATALLQLVGEGKLSLDDTVERWLPGVVPGGGAISIRSLLDHTSGLFDYTNDPSLLEPYLQGNFDYEWSPQQLVAVATSHQPLFTPGTSWSYSNTNYVLLGLVAQAATGHSLGGELARRIFRPLDLRATMFARSPTMARPYAHGYTIVGTPPALDVSAVSPSWAWAAGNIVSTVDDLARFYRALLQGRLLSPGLLQEMETTVSMGAPGEEYGLGLWKSRNLGLSATHRLPCGAVWGHNGDIPGYVTYAFGSRNGVRQIVVMVNSDSLSAKATTALDRLVDAAYC